MRSRILAGWLLIFAVAMLACSLGGSSSTPAPIDTPAPTARPQSVPSLTPTNEPTYTPTATINATSSPLIGVATATPVTGTGTLTETATPQATASPTSQSRPTQSPSPQPVSTGPLNFTVSVVGCRADTSRDGGVILTLKFEPSGGNGVYAYFDEGKSVDQTFDRPATKGSGVIDAFRVDSGGQSISHKIQFKLNDYCHF